MQYFVQGRKRKDNDTRVSETCFEYFLEAEIAYRLLSCFVNSISHSNYLNTKKQYRGEDQRSRHKDHTLNVLCECISILSTISVSITLETSWTGKLWEPFGSKNFGRTQFSFATNFKTKPYQQQKLPRIIQITHTISIASSDRYHGLQIRCSTRQNEKYPR